MIISFLNLKKIMRKPLTLTIYILNFIILFSIFSYTVFFYIKINNFFLSNIIIILSMITLYLKLLYWNSIKKIIKFEIINKIEQYKTFLLRSMFCIFTYLTPAYYIFKQESLIMNDNIILISLILISIIASIGMLIEKYLFFIESKHISGLNHEIKII